MKVKKAVLLQEDLEKLMDYIQNNFSYKMAKPLVDIINNGIKIFEVEENNEKKGEENA